eukprot:Polyplicarium_translucidae@DN3101_c0_g1_i3.p1
MSCIATQGDTSSNTLDEKSLDVLPLLCIGFLNCFELLVHRVRVLVRVAAEYDELIHCVFIESTECIPSERGHRAAVCARQEICQVLGRGGVGVRSPRDYLATSALHDTVRNVLYDTVRNALYDTVRNVLYDTVRNALYDTVRNVL